jgi:UDP-N-acetylmuramyl pentapeptide phosphotransferase/UDP-N-acetylglucosamine-1-phosphate transferase
MAKQTPAAGGCFLIIAILAGFGIGASQGNPVGGTMLGLIAGIVIAVIVWLVDSARIARRQQPSTPTPESKAAHLPTRDGDPPRSRGR